MKFETWFLLGSLFVSTIEAHYFWSWLHVNETQFPRWKYVRDVAWTPGYVIEPENPQGKANPLYDLFSTDFTCGRDAFASAAKTETADVIAGTQVGFRVDRGVTDENDHYSGVNHPGPAQAYLAKAPNGDLENFSGYDGDWFKIALLGAKTDTEWVVQEYDHRVVNFTIPAKTPPGKYLLRFEQFWPSKRFMRTQFFLNCAHINVIGPGGGNLDGYEFAKFPGTYDYMDPGIWAGDGTNDDFPIVGLMQWVAPGPPLWEG